MVIAILLQEGKAAGLSSSLAGSSDTYWSRNKGRSKKGKLERITTICGIAFLVIAILLNVKAFTSPAKASNINTEVVTEAAVETEEVAETEEAVETEAAETEEAVAEETEAVNE